MAIEAVVPEPTPAAAGGPRRPRAACAWRLAPLAMAAFMGLFSAPAAADCGGMVLHAHRGSPEHPENSLTGIQAALQGSWDGIEVDVQQLRDGTSVLHHDLQLGRTTSVQGRAANDLDAAAWRHVRLKSRQGSLTREAPPFLSDVLAIMKESRKLLNAEIKLPYSNCGAAERSVRAMHEGLPGGQWFLTAIDRNHLRCVRQFDPSGYVGLIVVDYQSLALQDKRFPNPMSLQQPQIDARWMDGLLREVSPPVGLHLDVHTLESRPSLLSLARERNMPVFTYSLSGDQRHTAVLKKVAAQTQLWPSGAIIDGDPDAFCKAVRS